MFLFPEPACRFRKVSNVHPTETTDGATDLSGTSRKLNGLSHVCIKKIEVPQHRRRSVNIPWLACRLYIGYSHPFVSPHTRTYRQLSTTTTSTLQTKPNAVNRAPHAPCMCVHVSILVFPIINWIDRCLCTRTTVSRRRPHRTNEARRHRRMQVLAPY